MIYLVLIILLCVCWYISACVVQQRNKQGYNFIYCESEPYWGNDVYKPLFIFAVFLLILLVGLRKVNIGWDTVQYYASFNKLKTFETIQDVINYKLSGGTTMEWAFVFYTWVIGKIGTFELFNIVSVALYIIPIAIYIYRYSENKFLSLFLFTTFGLYIFAFSTIRQSIAMGICFLAIIYGSEKNKPVRYFLLVTLAVLFHRTALIFVPAYFYNKLRINRITAAAIAILAVLFYRFRSVILTFLLGFARNTGSSVETGGLFQYLFVVGVVLLGIYLMRYWNVESFEKNRMKFLFICQSIVLVILPILRVSPTYFRLYYYNYMFMVVYVPNILAYIPDRNIRRIAKMFLFLLGSYLFYKQIVHTTNPLLPYYFFWQN